MATVAAMVRSGNYSLFDSLSAAKNNSKRNSVNALWQNYNSSMTANVMNSMAGLSEIRSGVSSVMNSYDRAKDTFYTEFDDTMSALKNSAAKVSNLNLGGVDFGENPITTKSEVDKNGNTTTTTTYSKPLQDALDNIKSFVNNYNDSISFLRSNSEVSGRVGRMAENFGDATYRSSLYSEIGINVGSNGTLSIDEEKLTNMMVSEPDKVSRLVGKDGLAGQAERHVQSAEGQRASLFPSAKSMFGNQLETAALYTSKSYINMTMLSNIGNLVNMMF